MHQFDGGAKGTMAGWRHAVPPDGNPPRGGDFGRDLGAWQDAAVPGLGALGQLDFDHADIVAPGHVGKALLREAAVVIAAAEVARADVPDEIAAVFQMVCADPSFAGVM